MKKLLARMGEVMIALALVTSPALAVPERIVTLGGDITEIVFALGAGEAIVGTDTTSLYPAETTPIPKLGYVRALGAEGIVSLKPDLVLASADAGPEAALDKVAATGVPVIRLEKAFDAEGIQNKISLIAGALDLQDKGKALAASVARAMAELPEASDTPPRALFVLSVQGQSIMAAGRGTAGDAALTLAGAENLMGDLTGYQPVSSEALMASPPDAVVIMDNAVGRMGGLDALVSHPALAKSPAVKNNKVLVVDGMALLGFGPRTPDALRSLHERMAE